MPSSLPIIVDADTGFGNAVNMVRTVRLLERAGAAGIQIEDQVFPKKCGHFDGQGRRSRADEMVQKIKAAVDARHDADLQIIARTDARAVDGFDRRDRAGARLSSRPAPTSLFVEAPSESTSSPASRARSPAPHVANIVFGGKTPDPGASELAEMGFGIVLYANAALQAALKASYDVLGALKTEGSLASRRGAARLVRGAAARRRQARMGRAREPLPGA